MSSKKGQGKCHRAGRITRNPFLNFLRDYRRSHVNMTVVQIACEGAKEWRSMSDEQKQIYGRNARLGRKERTRKSPVAAKNHSPRDSKSPRRSMSMSRKNKMKEEE